LVRISFHYDLGFDRRGGSRFPGDLEWFQKEPIVDVRLFKVPNVAASNLMFLMLGMALFSSTVLMPQLLQTLMGYSAQQAGMVLSAGALVVLVVLPMVGKLTPRNSRRAIS